MFESSRFRQPRAAGPLWLRDGSLVLATFVAAGSPAFAQAGTLDTSFGTDGKVLTNILGPGYEHPVDTALFARGNDGRFVVVGAVEEILNSSDQGNWIIERHLEDGTPDPAFGTGGWVSFDVNGSSSTPDTYGYPPRGVALDGNSIVVAGTRYDFDSGAETVVARFREDGSLDPNFGVGGVVVYDPAPQAECFGVAVENGRILVGIHTFPGGTSQVLALSSNGSLSSTYGNAGVADLGTYYGMFRLLGRGDGRVLAVGRTGNLSQGIDTWVVGLDHGGALDGSFGSGGILHTVAADVSPGSVSLRPGGGLALLDSISGTGERQVRRFGESGAFEGSFPVSSIAPSDLAVAADDSVFLTGSAATPGFVAAKYGPSGQLDASFGTWGVAVHDIGTLTERSNLVEVLPSGAVLLVGSSREGFYTGDNSITVARLTPSSALDPTFGGGTGYVSIEAWSSPQWDFARDVVAMQGDGRILVLGSSYGYGAQGESSGPVLLRYEPDGSLDTTFGVGGIQFLEGGAVAMGLQSTGRIVVAAYPGGADSDITVFGFDPDGELDPTFGNGGSTSIELPEHQAAQSLTILPDDRILVGGSTRELGTCCHWDAVVARLEPDGAPDTTFGGGGSGHVVLGAPAVDDSIAGLAVASDGRIFTALAQTTQPFQLVIVAADGSTATYLPTGIVGSPAGVVMDDVDRVIVGVRLVQTTSAARFLSNGALDTSFGDDGLATLTVGTYSGTNMVAVQGDRKVIAIGNAFDQSQPDRGWDFGIVRWNEDGTPDQGFGTDGAATVDFGTSAPPYYDGSDAPVAVALQGDGDILVAGTVTTWNFFLFLDEQYDIGLARLHGLTTPMGLIESLVPVAQAYAEAGLLNNGEANSLQAKLAACLQLLDSGNTAAAIHQIESFENQVAAMIGSGTLSEEDGQVLLDWAEDILAALNGD